MNTDEAREIYLKSDCSYFQMCNHNYSKYLEYRRLGTTKEEEEKWKNEKIHLLYQELRMKQDSRLFGKLYDITVEFRDCEKLQLMYEALNFLKYPMEPHHSVCVAEIILGKKAWRVRSGLIYWAYDIGQMEMAVLFVYETMYYLNISHVTNVELNKRIKKMRRLCKRIVNELALEMPF